MAGSSHAAVIISWTTEFTDLDNCKCRDELCISICCVALTVEAAEEAVVEKTVAAAALAFL